MNKLSYEVQVLVNGKPVKEYKTDGKTYIQGNTGTRYSIRVKNNSYKRVMAVVYVDGNSVLNDKNDDSGYVIDGYKSVTINGFRTSMDTEAAFEFSRKGDSRAQKVKGNAVNCGAIGVKIIAEKEKGYIIPCDLEKFKTPNPAPPNEWPWPPNKPWYPYWYDTHTAGTPKPWEENITYGENDAYFSSIGDMKQNECEFTASNCSMDLTRSAGKFDLGTKMGEDVDSKVEYVDFESGRKVAEFTLYYSSRKELTKMGVPLTSQKKISMPDAFGGFCRRPK
jgi:hypothetical protein